VNEVLQRFGIDPAAVWWLAGFSAFAFVTTLIAIPVIVVRMRPDHFVRPRPADDWRESHPAVRTLLIAVKNLVGLALVLTGVILSLPLVPGQGILTVLIGLSLIDFPGKRSLELRLARQRHVLRAVNWIRFRADRPALEMPPRDEP
jgi:hypothetical protein